MDNKFAEHAIIESHLTTVFIRECEALPLIHLKTDGTWTAAGMEPGKEFIPVGGYRIGVGKENFGTWERDPLWRG